MRAFTYPLQSLLTFRAHLKEQASQAWVKALWELQTTTLECQHLLVHLKSWQQTRRAQQSGTVLAGDLTRNNMVAHEIYQQWVTHERLRQSLAQQAREALEKWREARRKEEILERLKQRSLMTWNREQEKQAQKIIDERASFMVFQRQISSQRFK